MFIIVELNKPHSFNYIKEINHLATQSWLFSQHSIPILINYYCVPKNKSQVLNKLRWISSYVQQTIH